MAICLGKFKGLLRKVKLNPIALKKYSNDLYEPDYLAGLQSKVPLYNTLNIQLKGYDFPVLENYQKFVNKLATNMDINVEDAWALPPQNIHISTFKPQSEIVNNEYHLNVYQRFIQISSISSLQLPILIRALESSTPAGVTIEIINHEPYHEEIRYVPDTELNTLKQELDDMGGPSKKK